MVKKGFSLVEALVVMTILAVFFAFGARVMTQKPKLKKQNNEHGYYECYFTGSGLVESWVIDGIPPTTQTVSRCRFNKTTKAAFYNVHVLTATYQTRANPNYEVSFDYTNLTEEEEKALREAKCRRETGHPDCSSTAPLNSYPLYRKVVIKVNGVDTPYFHVYNWYEVEVKNTSYHRSYEPNINDNLTFNIPSSMFVGGEKYSIELKPTEGLTGDDFKHFVKNSYPSAGIYDSYNDQLQAGVMITW